MSEVNKLNDDQLENVSGGAGVTKWGFPYDDAGTVTYTDKSGASIKINKADWQWLLGKYKGPIEDPEYYLSTVPAKDITTILNDHHAGKN